MSDTTETSTSGSAPSTIFITGGGSGIGRAIAQLFAERGWRVGLGDIDATGMSDTLALLPKDAGRSYPLDVRKPAQWQEALAAFAEWQGKIDVVVNNVGIPSGGMIIDHSEEEIDAVLDINLRGVINGARASYPYLKDSAPGSCLLNICSAAGLYGSAGMSLYCASKFGVRAVTESLDVEWAGDGIKVRSLMPSFIDTPLLQKTANHKDNTPLRDRVTGAGLEFTPVEQVAETAWKAVHGRKLHTVIGDSARKLAFAAKWMPEKLRNPQALFPQD